MKPLVNSRNSGSRDCGMLGGHNSPDNQPAQCPSLFPAGGVSGDRALEHVDASLVDTELGLCQL